MKYFLSLLISLFSISSFAQETMQDSIPVNKVTIFKDARLSVLEFKQFEINSAILKTHTRTTLGYRLMVLNTSDKDYAFKIRTELLQRFPEQKPYMWFANPYIRIKFGNFRTKDEAEYYKKQISYMLGGANVYFLQEMIEIPPGSELD